MKINQKGLSVVEALLVMITLILAGGIGYCVYQTNQDKKTDNSVSKNTNEQSTKSEEPTDNGPINAGLKTYTSSAQKVSFEYPEGWFVREDSEENWIYVSNHQGEFNKGNRPDDFQQLGLSTSEQEATAENESSVKSGSPKGRAAGPVTAGTIKAGAVTINTYEYQTVGGPTLQAFWTVSGKMFYATSLTEVGAQQQTEMVSNLKRLLPTVKHL